MGVLSPLLDVDRRFSAWSQATDRATLARVLLEQVQDTGAHDAFSADIHALLGAIGAARARVVFTDAELAWYAEMIREGLDHGDILLRLDAAILSLKDLDDESRRTRLSFVERRAAETRSVLAARDRLLAIDPRARRYWTDALNDELHEELRRYEEVIQQVRNGTFPLREDVDVGRDLVRFLPVSLGDIREFSEEVVQYAARHQLVLLLIAKVLPMLRVAFIRPGNLQAAIIEDADLDEDWLDIEFDVDKDERPDGEDPAKRYLAFIRILYRTEPPAIVNRLRFSYRVRPH